MSGRWLSVVAALLIVAGLALSPLVDAQTQQAPLAPDATQNQTGPPPVSLSALIDQTLAAFPDVQADIVEAQGTGFVISAGRRGGALSGLSLEVYREGREIKHPRTGQVLGRAEETIGRVVVERVFDGYAVVRPEDGQPAVGDRVRTATGKVKLSLVTLADPGVRENLVEAATNEVYEGLTRSGRFSVTLGDQIALWVKQQSIAPADFVAGRGVADVTRTLKADNILVLYYRQVDRRPFIDARLFTSGRQDAVVTTGLFVPSAIKPVQPGRFSSADRFQRETPERKPRSLLARLLGGDLESDRYSSAQSIPLKEVGRFGYAAAAMDVAVAPGDGIPRVAISDGNRIWMYKIVNQVLEAEWSLYARSVGTVFSLQLADLQGDGQLQIVANRWDPRLGLNSLIAGIRDGKPQALIEGADLAMLAVDSKGTGTKQTLWAQPSHQDTFFSKGRVDRMELRDGKLVTIERVIVPSDFRATGATLATLAKDSRTLTFIDEHNRLRIVNGTEELWRSGSAVGGGLSKIAIERWIERGGRYILHSHEPNPLALDLDGDGLQEVIVPQNQIEGMIGVIYRGPAGYRFQQLNSGFEGTIVSLGGYAAADGGSPTIVAAVVKYLGIARTNAETQIIMTLSND